MSEFSSWSLQIGRWRRVPIRLHALFLAAMVVILYLSAGESAAYGLMAAGILLASVLAHEIGHMAVALRTGATAEPIVIGPLGGLGSLEIARESQPELLVALAGPLVSLAVVLVTLPTLVATQTPLAPLLSPLQPSGLLQGEWWMAALKQTFWINWLLLAANLLPAFPFDAARVLRALLWPALDYRTSGHVIVRSTKLTALALCVLAWVLVEPANTDVLPAWVPLGLLAIFIYFCARFESARLEEREWDDEMFGYDFSQGYTSLERSGEVARRGGGALGRWLRTRRELRQRRRETQEQDEDRRVDEILTRLHQLGMNGLTSKERALLNRVSARYRGRPNG